MNGGVSDATLWAAILSLGLGTFLVRWSFIGALGGRTLPDWATRLLRYVPVTVIPALVAPMVAWPKATGGEPDPVRVAAAFAALAVGAVTRNAIAAIVVGMAVIWSATALGI
ncbi:AzlD domain-containing protein [Rhodovulum sp. DZ06]|uniref:AzlD domain-containing protein n=1 Tax=Rhodovulum sp. DZ06 TaxID=3425126 RepID=UPI003D3414C6